VPKRAKRAPLTCCFVEHPLKSGLRVRSWLALLAEGSVRVNWIGGDGAGGITLMEKCRWIAARPW